MSTICIFSSQYLPHMGGVERYTYNLARYLVKRGDKVIVVTSLLAGMKEYEVAEGIKVFRLPCFNLMNGRYPVLKMNARFFSLHKKLMTIPIDLVLVNTRFYFHSVYGAIFAKKKKTKCIMIEHGTGHLAVHHPLGDRICQMVEHTLTVIDKIYCKDFYGVSGACTEWLTHFHIKAKGVLYNAVDLNEIEQIKQKKLRDFRGEYNIPDDAVVITFTGRLLKEKGILQLTDAVNELREKENLPVFLMIAGDGDEENALRKKAGEGVILLGRLDLESIIGLLMQTDIFCLPSDSEGFSTSVLEAAACRCYIITTERGGAKEMITDRSYGMIIRENDVKTIMDALREVVPQREYCKEVASKTYQRLSENYTWDIVAEYVHKLSEDLYRSK